MPMTTFSYDSKDRIHVREPFTIESVVSKYSDPQTLTGYPEEINYDGYGNTMVKLRLYTGNQGYVQYGTTTGRLNTTKGEDDMRTNATAVHTVSDAEMAQILGLDDSEEITGIQWERGSNNFPGGIVVTTKKAEVNREISAKE
jgi:hypothetical protein